MAGLFKKILQRLSRDHIDWDQLEESLILGDLDLRPHLQERAHVDVVLVVEAVVVL